MRKHFYSFYDVLINIKKKGKFEYVKERTHIQLRRFINWLLINLIGVLLKMSCSLELYHIT